jgi:hypothetical protein
MKAKVEIHINSDDEIFLNYWDNIYGNDVICQIINGKIIHNNIDVCNFIHENKEITMMDFIKMVQSNESLISDELEHFK